VVSQKGDMSTSAVQGALSDVGADHLHDRESNDRAASEIVSLRRRDFQPLRMCASRSEFVDVWIG
jgi:hypothetical protein